MVEEQLVIIPMSTKYQFKNLEDKPKMSPCSLRFPSLKRSPGGTQARSSLCCACNTGWSEASGRLRTRYMSSPLAKVALEVRLERDRELDWTYRSGETSFHAQISSEVGLEYGHLPAPQKSKSASKQVPISVQLLTEGGVRRGKRVVLLFKNTDTTVGGISSHKLVRVKAFK